ncbi:MAG: HlyD family efflux transporter periplasmic adaptor subunit, partial [Gammaproteobacteria bacterium]|nr:HlyD family efflux transporter periplasmic adaptor subunit [Gammaproteobacteria bacterium]
QGEIAALRVSVTRTQSSLNDTRQELEVVNREDLEQTWRDIEQTQNQLEEVAASLEAARDRLSRLVITAPDTGRVHELAIKNVNAVVTPGETILQIVPVDAGSVISARVRLIDIDQVHLGQSVRIRFETFDMRTTPEIAGHVMRISADRSVDQQTGESFFSVLVDLPDAELARLEGRVVIPGLPATAMFTTGERTLLDYLTKPLREQLFAAFREG